MIYDAQNMDLSALGPEKYVFTPTGAVIEAVQVTRENIGILSMLLDTEMKNDSTGVWIGISVKRDRYSDGYQMAFYLGDWIVPVKGEIRRFPDYTFRHTFVRADGRPFPDGLVLGSVHTMMRYQNSGALPPASEFDQYEKIDHKHGLEP